MRLYSPRQRLEEWQQQLDRQVKDSELLLGDLPTSQDDLNALRALLHEQLAVSKNQSIENRLKLVKALYPLPYALYLVLEGQHSYQDGEFWPTPSHTFHLRDANETSRCGQLFLDIVSRYGLPTFEEKHRGHRFVTSILLHGGVPTTQLPRFFTFLHQESRDHEIRVDAETLLQDWRSKREVYLDPLPAPIRRFLLHGGVMAEDFLDRCLELISLTRREAESETAWGLSGRVVDTYWQWRQETHTPATRQSQYRLQRPILFLAPYDDGLCLDIANAQLPLRYQSARWIIQPSGLPPIQLPTDRTRQNGSFLFCVPETVRLPLACEYKVKLVANASECVREWVIERVDKSGIAVLSPYDDRSADVLGLSERDQPGYRWLLYPKGGQLNVPAGSQRYTQLTLPDYLDGKQPFHLEAWEVAPGSLSLTVPGRPALPSLEIVDGVPVRRPHFVGGQRFLAGHTPSRYALYSGLPPKIAFSLNPQKPVEAQLRQWHLALRADQGSFPSSYRSYRLIQLRQWLQKENEQGLYSLDLASPQLLGNKPAGKFELRLRGSFGRGRVLGLQILPALTVEGAETVYFDSRPASLKIHCSPRDQIAPAGGEKAQKIKLHRLTSGAYEVTVDPSIWQAELLLKTEDGWQMPLSLPLHRLRWGLQENEGVEGVSWQNKPLRFKREELNRQPPSSALCVDLSQLEGMEPITCGFQLIDAAGQVKRHRGLEKQHYSHYRIPFSELKREARESAGSLRCQLLLAVGPEQEQQRVELANLELAQELENLRGRWHVEESSVQLLIQWSNDIALSNYQLYLWPVEKLPWQSEPIILPIPDQTEQRFRWRTRMATVLPIAYTAAIVPLNQTLLSPPAPGQANVFVLEAFQGRDVYEWLSESRDEEEATAAQLFYLFTHQAADPKSKEAAIELGMTSYSLWHALTRQDQHLPACQLLEWARVVNNRLPRAAYEKVQAALYHPPIFAAVFQSDLTIMQVQEYFSHQAGVLPTQLRVYLNQSESWQRYQMWLKVRCQQVEGKPAYRQRLEAILEEISKGRLAAADVVKMLQYRAEAAVPMLADGKHPAARSIAVALIETEQLPWVYAGRCFQSEFGCLRVDLLRQHDRTIPLAHYSEAVAAVTLHPDTPYQLTGTLTFFNQQLALNVYGYQCQYCEHVFASQETIEKHRLMEHRGLPVRRQRFKSAYLTQLEPLIAHSPALLTSFYPFIEKLHVPSSD